MNKVFFLNGFLAGTIKLMVTGLGLLLVMMPASGTDVCADFDDIPVGAEFHVGDTGFSWGMKSILKSFLAIGR